MCVCEHVCVCVCEHVCVCVCEHVCVCVCVCIQLPTHLIVGVHLPVGGDRLAGRGVGELLVGKG